MFDVKNTLRYILTERNGRTYDIVRGLSFIGVLAGILLQVYATFRQVPFDLQNYGTGITAMIGGLGASLALKPDATTAPAEVDKHIGFKEILTQILTQNDNQAHDIVRWLSFVGVLTGIFLQIYATLMQVPFELQSYGTGVGFMVGSLGLSMKLKPKETEKPADPASSQT